MFAHIDADSFFASVLIRKDPRLRGKPLLALGMGGSCVIAATYEAKAFGVKTGMTLKDALKLVPNALQIPSDFRETAIASHEIEEILSHEGPTLEQMSVDEWFLDITSVVGGEPQDLHAWATALQKKILRHTALSVSVGVGQTKLLAKMAGEYKKPAGVTVLHTHEEASCMLKDRPAAAIPGIGRRRDIHAQLKGWKTAWDFAVADQEEVIRLFGKGGHELQLELNGTIVSPVTTEEDPPKSVSRARSFFRTADRSFLWAHTLRHLEYVVLKMRRDDLACSGVTLWLRGWDYGHEGANRKLPQPMNTEEQLRPYVKNLFSSLYEKQKQYSQVGLGLFHLTPRGAPQYSLFEETRAIDRNEKIQQTLDTLHERFGRNKITRGAAMAVSSQTKPQIPLSLA